MHFIDFVASNSKNLTFELNYDIIRELPMKCCRDVVKVNAQRYRLQIF